MQSWETPEAFRSACSEARTQGRTVGLVPTMGALHAGHMALVAEARRRANFVAVTVFVNPTQFGPGEDFQRYPRTVEADLQACEAAGVSGVFMPSAETMYPKGEETRVRVGPTAAPLEGQHRPGHFEGVTTIVAKLFALAGPCTAVFGRKDYQQLQVLRRMTQDLYLPVDVVGMATLRESDGLALSSRNRYLSAEERARALSIAAGLRAAHRAFTAGERDAATLRELALRPVAAAFDAIDYVSLADPDTLAPLTDSRDVGSRALVAVAARIGRTRLIDNLVLGEDPEPLGDCP